MPACRASAPPNLLLHGDNLAAMQSLLPDYRGTVTLIYADPPFATGAAFRMGRRNGAGTVAYRDSWQGGVEAYLDMLRPRLAAMHELLGDRGSLYLHVDWRVEHHARLLLDDLFGPACFRNTIAWHYGGRGAKAVSGQFPRNHDTILYYAKTPAAPYHRQTSVARVALAEASRHGIRRDGDGRWFKTAPRGDYPDASIARLEGEGRVHRTRGGGLRVKYFLQARDGAILVPRLMGDVWSDIPDMMHAPAVERTGYPTQKPEALLDRIIAASSDPDDLVADFFCGAGTALTVAQRLGRRWIGADSSDAAIAVTCARLAAPPGLRAFVLRAL